MLDDLKVLLGIADDTQDTLLNLLLSKATTKFQNYCHRLDIPDSAQSSITDYAVILYNRRGSEGLNSESYSGVNNNFETGIPQSIKSEWNSFAKMVTL